MKAMEHAIDGAGVAAVGKQEWPAAGVARQPGPFVGRSAGLQRRLDRPPRDAAKHGKPRDLVADLGDRAAHAWADRHPQRTALQHHVSAHLSDPAIKPWM